MANIEAIRVEDSPLVNDDPSIDLEESQNRLGELVDERLRTEFPGAAIIYEVDFTARAPHVRVEGDHLKGTERDAVVQRIAATVAAVKASGRYWVRRQAPS